MCEADGTKTNPSVLLVDVNNVRGQVNFVPLPDFCSAVWRWAQAADRPDFVVLAVDHGEPMAFRLSPRFAVVFSGCKSDADTVIVHTVDYMFSQLYERRTVTVVTHDRLLLRRTQFNLPAAPEDSEWYLSRGLVPPGNPEFAPRGARRAASQRERLLFRTSDDFAAELRRSALLSVDDDDGHDEALEAGPSAAVADDWLARLLGFWLIAQLLSLLRVLLPWLPAPASQAVPSRGGGMFAAESPRWLTTPAGARRPKRLKPGKKTSIRRKRTKRRENSADRVAAADAMLRCLQRAAQHGGVPTFAGEQPGAADATGATLPDGGRDRVADYVRWFMEEQPSPLLGSHAASASGPA